MKKFLAPLLIIFSVLTVDQVLKFWIKLSFYYTEQRHVSSWFYLYFIENEGMAFGIEWGGEFGKLALTLFRLVASGFIWYWLYRLVTNKAHWGLIACVALIFAGAVGNIIDSIFYGVIFSESNTGTIATLFPAGGGYSTLLHGRVVDMLYFPLWEGYLPGWIPVWGGDYFVFFQPIFNIADASISIGVIAILVFQKWIFKEGKEQNKIEETQPNTETKQDGSNLPAGGNDALIP